MGLISVPLCIIIVENAGIEHTKSLHGNLITRWWAVGVLSIYTASVKVYVSVEILIPDSNGYIHTYIQHSVIRGCKGLGNTLVCPLLDYPVIPLYNNGM